MQAYHLGWGQMSCRRFQLQTMPAPHHPAALPRCAGPAAAVLLVIWGGSQSEDEIPQKNTSFLQMADRAKAHVKLEGGQRGGSIQQRIIAEMRSKGKRLQDLFRQWDTDRSGTVSKSEFCRALKQLNIAGGVEDYDSLFDAWDTDLSGTLQVGEIWRAVSGRRYDAFEAFDADIGDATSKVGQAAARALSEATQVETTAANELAEAEAATQRKWLMARWRVAQQGISAAIWLSLRIRGDAAGSPHDNGPLAKRSSVEAPTPDAGASGASTGGFPAPEAEEDCGGELDEAVAEEATRAAKRLVELALRVQLSDSADEQLDAENALRRQGVSYEHLGLPPAQLTPLLFEMAFARSAGSSDSALAKLPPPAFFGPPAGLRLPSPATAPRLDLHEGGGTFQCLSRFHATSPRPAPPPAVVACVLVSRTSEGIGWLAQLPAGVSYHVLQKGALQPELPAARQSTVPNVGGAPHAFLSYLASVAAEDERGKQARRADGRLVNTHVRLEKAQFKSSIQERIHEQLRKRGERVRDLLRRVDADRSNTVSLAEFCTALQRLGIAGTRADYESLFAAWDVDASGQLQYNELLDALSGQRYDGFVTDEPPPPPIPPLLICTPADPLQHNPRFLEDVALLAHLAASVSGDASGGGASGGGGERAALPAFTPLGLSRGPSPSSTDLPSWSRPEIHCDPSGAPQSHTMLPIGAVWRDLFGPDRPLPLWVGYVPGGLFAVSREAVLRSRPPAAEAVRHGERASAFYTRALATGGLDRRVNPAAADAVDRLWRHIFVPSSETVS